MAFEHGANKAVIGRELNLRALSEFVVAEMEGSPMEGSPGGVVTKGHDTPGGFNTRGNTDTPGVITQGNNTTRVVTQGNAPRVDVPKRFDLEQRFPRTLWGRAAEYFE